MAVMLSDLRAGRPLPQGRFLVLISVLIYQIGWFGPRDGLDAVKKRKISCSCRETNPYSSALQPVAIPTGTEKKWERKRGNGRALAQAVSRWFPTAAARIRVQAAMWGLWWTKRHRGRFSPSTSFSPANHHSTNFSIIIITRGWHNRPISGRSAEWTLISSPTIPIKKKDR
jgi:hypothetical protein